MRSAAPAHSKHAGKPLRTCGICGQRRQRTKVTAVLTRLRWGGAVVPVGTVVCSGHELLAITHAYWRLCDVRITPELIDGWITEYEVYLSQGKPESDTADDWVWRQGLPRCWQDALEQHADDLIPLANTVRDFIAKSRGINPYRDYNAQDLFVPPIGEGVSS